ncbi:secretory subunit [Stygiomarasmius scandens]|uniref:Secretory subunit n=1 Tax=Marasmiellus scandens TaxID=2682957 RepID=A0ABR1J645_9AGAR
MANYHYDEAGNMATYFLITFLVFILVPLTFSITPSKKKSISGCQCQACIEQRQRVAKREGGSVLNPKLSKKTIFVLCGWSLVAYLAYKVTNAELDNKIYDPFEILGIKMGSTDKEIKSHFKKLSKVYHPDKVKATVNETIEEISNRFVEITKAYKALTDETIRKNWEQYGHPDGRQEMSMGIAIPKGFVEGKNRIWVLGFYGLVFGGALPAMVGRWWFGSRQKTKDGVNAKSAAAFFKGIKEDSGMEDVVGTLGKAYQFEGKGKSNKVKADAKAELERLESEVAGRIGKQWKAVKGLVGAADREGKRALILIYAHLLRLEVRVASLQEEQTKTLLQTPTLLNALLNVSMSRNWLAPTMCVMRLHAYIVQALLPHESPAKQRLAQLPGIKVDEAKGKEGQVEDIPELISRLEADSDGRVVDVKKAAERWGRLELVDAGYKVIGERIVTPSSIVYLVVKLRLSPPGRAKKEETKKEPTVDEVKKSIRANEEKDNAFLMSRKDAEDLPEGAEDGSGWAHAPFWPGNRKPSWWLVIADEKLGKVVVPPLKITGVPFSDSSKGDRDYRAYKLQFQAPQGPGMYTWKMHVISDTFVGEEVSKDMTLKVDDMSALNADEQGAEDEISDPEEDSLAGQMAAMRGGSVKKGPDEESDEESSTDDDESDDSSDSDSD